MCVSSWIQLLPFATNRIRWLRQSRKENCVQTVIAILLGIPTAEVERVAGTEGRLNVTEALSLLSGFGIVCRPISARLAMDFWPVFYRTNGGRRLRGLGFKLPREGEQVGHAYVIAGGKIYDPATGKFSKIDESTLAKLDWLALLPEEAYRTPQVKELRMALAGR